MKPRPIYIAIMAASEAGRGVSLSAAEVHELAQDDAIAHRAAVCLPDDDDFLNHDFTWTSALRAALNPPPVNDGGGNEEQ